MSTIRFPHQRARHCASGALRGLLAHHALSYGNTPSSEAFIFGAGAGLDFHVSEAADPDPWPQTPPSVWIMGRSLDFERRFCRHAGIGLETVETDDPQEGWARVAAELDRGRFVMLRADLAELEYLDADLRNAHHVVVVLGDAGKPGRVLISDGECDDVIDCSISSLARARASRGFPTPTCHTAWLMRFPEELPQPERLVRRAIEVTVATMCDGDRDPRGTGEPVGLAGVDAFAAGYADWPGRFDPLLGGALRRLRVFIRAAGTGGALFRSLQAGFLEEATGLLGDDRLQGCAQRFDTLAAAWVALAASVRQGAPEAGHAAGQPHVARICELEHQAVDSLAAWTAAG